MHKSGAKIVDSYRDATEAQKYFLLLMAVDDINVINSIDVKLGGIAKGLGVEFKGGDLRENRQSNSFREQMKEKQRKRRGVNLNGR